MNKVIKVIIAGSRTFNNYFFLKGVCDKIIDPYIQEGYKIEIVSGGAKGADSLADRYAYNRNFCMHTFNALWDRYGNQAGPIRNKQMAEYADMLICFWDGESSGSKNMIDEAYNNDLEVHVIVY